MMKRISSAITQFTLLLSAEAGAPAALRVAASFAWSQPSTFWSPIDVTTAPAGPSIDLNDRPCLVRKSLTRSQSENLLHGPTKMWNWHSREFAWTEIGVLAENCSSAGFTYCVRPGRSGRYVTAAIRQPA